MFNNERRFKVEASGTLKSIRVGSSRSSAVVQKSSSPETASLFGGGMYGGSGMGSMNIHASGPLATMTLLGSLVSEQEDQLRKYYRDIYYYDAIAGTAIDLMSSFPFSDFTLTGLPQDRVDKYMESLARLNIRALMPEISTTYLVDGSSINSLVFNEAEKVFIDVIKYSVDNCLIEQSPFHGADPQITVKNTADMIRFMNSASKQAKTVRSLLPTQLVNTLKTPAFELDPLTTLYLARRPLPGCEPISFLKRILPIYLLEKTLYRGTVIEANKRQRSMLHVQMGDDTHTFTPEEMLETVNQFQLADLDPLGAVIGTRNNVQASELRQGGDFWKWNDTIDVLTPYKLRALGISEAFLAGDANYSNAETAVSVFMENMDTYRAFITYETFTNRIFPIVAIANDFFKKGKETDTSTRRKMHYQINNPTDLDLPVLRWNKKLEAKDEVSMMDTLDKLTEKNFPIPMRMWAAAGRIDLQSYLHDLEFDKGFKEKIAALTGEKAEDIGKRIDEDQMSGEGGEYASIGKMVRRRNLLDRDFGEASEVVGRTKTGKSKYIHNQALANRTVNDLIVKATKNLSDPHTREQARRRVIKTLGSIPKILGNVRG